MGNNINTTELLQLKQKADAANHWFETEARDFVKDKSIPLNIRWEFFMGNELGNQEDSMVSFESLTEGKWKSWRRNPIKDSLFDGVSRGIIHMSLWDEFLFNYAVDKITFVIKKAYDGPEIDVVFETEDYNNWREEVLENYIKSFVFDW